MAYGRGVTKHAPRPREAQTRPAPIKGPAVVAPAPLTDVSVAYSKVKEEALREAVLVTSPVKYVVGSLPLRYGDAILQPGDEVPDAHLWPRVESWIRTRRIIPVPRSTS